MRVCYYICKYNLLKNNLNFKNGWFSINNFNEVCAYFGQCHCGYSFYEHYNPAAAFALDFYKVTFCAIEYTTVNADFSAFFYINLFGAQICDAFVVGISDCDELLHLIVGNGDWNIFAVFWSRAVLQKIDTLLQGFDCFFSGVDEYQIVYCRNFLTAFAAIASVNESLLHRDKTLDVFFVEEFFGNEFATVWCAHCKPDNTVLCVHVFLFYWSGSCCRMGIPLAPRWLYIVLTVKFL